jgi:hypothetical protein
MDGNLSRKAGKEIFMRVWSIVVLLLFSCVGVLRAQNQPCELIYGQRFVFASFETETPDYTAECTFDGEEGDALRLISSISPPNWVLSSEDGSYQVTSEEYLNGQEIVLPVTGRYRLNITLASLRTSRTTFIPNQAEQIEVVLPFYVHYGSVTLRRVALPSEGGGSPNQQPQVLVPEGEGLSFITPNYLEIFSTAYTPPEARPLSEATGELCTDESVDVTLSVDEIYVVDAAEADAAVAAGGDDLELYYGLAVGTRPQDFDFGSDEIPVFTSELFSGDSVTSVAQVTRRINCSDTAFAYIGVYESGVATLTPLGRDIVFPLVSEDTPGDERSFTVEGRFTGPIYDGRYDYRVLFTVTFGSTVAADDVVNVPTTVTRAPAPTPTPAGDSSLVRQWAARAEATSEYSYPQYGAVQATGAPDTVGCGDFPTTWASQTISNYDQLTLFYDTPVIPTAINIYQTFGRGSIVQVDVVTTSGEIISLPNSADPPTIPPICPGVFTVDVSGFDVGTVNGVVITLDQTIRGMWNEIDAVELVGRPG